MSPADAETAERRRRALAVLREALALEPDEQHRQQSLLDARCAGDVELRREIEALLAADADVDGALDTPIQWQAEPVIEPPDDLIGIEVGAFRIIERIGRGGMGTVYRGERERAEFRQQVAIKVLRRGLDSDDILARFLRERRILASLSHPNLTRLIDGGRTPDGRPWLAMDFVRGEAITTWCDRQCLDPRARIVLLLDVAAAVQHAHERLVVHRDLKPGNVLVDDDGHVHLLDFGIAKLVADDADDADDQTQITRFGGPGLLTPEYAAPEQLTGGTIRAGTDVYALGVMLYELLTGRLPYVFEHRDWHSVQSQVRDSQPPRLAQAITDSDSAAPLLLQQRATTLTAFRRLVRGDLERILAKALAKEPERRYATVQAFADDLRRFLAGQPVLVAGTEWRYRFGKFIARNRAGAALAALSMILLVVGVSGIVWQWRQAQEQALLARAEAQRANAIRDYLTLMFREARGDGAQPGQISAREVLDRSANRIELEFAADPALRQSVLTTMAELYIHLQDYQGARPLLERFIALEDGSSPTGVHITALDDLAVVELRQGDAGKALAWADEALGLIEANPSPDVARLRARVMITRGQILRALGRIDDAIADLERALQLTEAADGVQARQTAVARNSLALGYMIAGRSADALREFEATLASFERLGLGESSDALTTLGNLGALKLMRGRIDEAEPLLERAMQLQRSLVGDSAGLAATMLNHGRVLLLRNRIDQARRQMLDARELIRQFTATDSLDMVGAELALADAALMSARPDEAMSHADAALAIVHRLLPASHPVVGRVHVSRAQSMLLNGDHAAALLEIEQGLAILSSSGASGNTHLARALCLRAELGLTATESVMAAADAGRCLALRGEYADPASWEIAHAAVLLALAQARGPASDAAGQQLRSARRQLREALGVDHPIYRQLVDHTSGHR